MNASTGFLVTLSAWVTASLRSVRLAALTGVLLVLNACAIAQGMGDIEHGLSVANKGDSKIQDVLIQYGKITRKECTVGCPPKSGGGVWNAPMPIPDKMLVSWQTADGQQHQVNVPVKSRLKDASRLRVLYLEFRDDQLKVIQALGYNNPTLFEFEELPLYP